MLHATGIHHFARAESGEATVSWVLISAGAIALTLAAMSLLAGGMEEKSDVLSTTIAERPVGSE